MNSASEPILRFMLRELNQRHEDKPERQDMMVMPWALQYARQSLGSVGA